MRKRIEWTLQAVNQRLKEGRMKVSVVQRGGMLWLQATLPPKPGCDRTRPYQQKVSLGVPANEAGFEQADREARLLSSRLISKTFKWADYMKAERLPENKSAARWIAEFKHHYLETHSMKASTWKDDWQKIFNRLPQDAPITEQGLLALVRDTKADTRHRQETCRKLQTLAEFIGIEVNLLQYRGGYGSSKVQDRDIPSDELVASCWASIPNASWRWMYGVMAAYGLRDHEAFFTEWRPDGLYVLKGKTGPRLVFQPLYPEWVEQWKLKISVPLPSVIDIEKVYKSGKLGDKIARQFRRYKIPFAPYDLRHAYGIRASVTFKLPVTTAAALMGHSPAVHLKRYQKHINLRENQSATRRAMGRDDAPKAPQLD